MDKAAEFKKANAAEKKAQERVKADGTKEFLDEETNEWVSKNELKNRTRLRKKAKDAAEKAAKAPPVKAKKAAAVAEEDLDANKYTDLRKHYIQSLRDQGTNPYPHKFDR